VKIEVYVSSSCSHRDQSLAAVSEATQATGVQDEPQVIVVGDYEDAKARRCFGSPTIRVNGVDVEYGDREPEEFSVGCRFYNSPDGWLPVPRMELIKRGIEAAQQREKAAR
jgi:hypothetical protein